MVTIIVILTYSVIAYVSARQEVHKLRTYIAQTGGWIQVEREELDALKEQLERLDKRLTKVEE